MPDIPDEVIEQAREAGTDGYARPDGPSRVREVAAEAAFAQVIAEWATERERDRIGRALNEADAALAAADDDERADWEGHVHALVSILNQEGEQ